MDNQTYNVKNFDTIFDYDTHVGDFDGPLDLLLYLVKQAQIEIKDIFVSQVTGQFMEYLNHLETLDIDKAGEYLGVAATLLYEKSKAILPKIEEFVEEEQEDDGQTLIRRLEELKLFKEMSVKLKELESVDRYYKAPEPSANDVRIIYKDFNLDGLVKALSDLLTRTELNRKLHEEKEIPKEVFTVQDKMTFMRERMLDVKECSFFELFSADASRPEIITTFQAMLELLKRQFIKVVQNGVFDDITITLNNDRSDDLAEFGDLSEYN